MKFPGLSSIYQSHTFGADWSYSVSVVPIATYEFRLGFAEVFNSSCAAGAGFRTFSVAIGNASEEIDVLAEVGCGQPLTKTYLVKASKKDTLTASFQGINEKAMLSTLCYKKVSAPPSPGTKSVIIPNADYKCLTFGPRTKGYQQYSGSSVIGKTTVFTSAKSANLPSLPKPYLSFMSGKSWTYQLSVATNNSRRIVLGFAEVQSKACASDRDAGFRTFTVTIQRQVRNIDVMKSSGCGVIEQVVFENVKPVNGVIEIVLFARNGSAMLSVICSKELGVSKPKPSALPSSSPSSFPFAETATPSPSLSTAPSVSLGASLPATSRTPAPSSTSEGETSLEPSPFPSMVITYPPSTTAPSTSSSVSSNPSLSASQSASPTKTPKVPVTVIPPFTDPDPFASPGPSTRPSPSTSFVPTQGGFFLGCFKFSKVDVNGFLNIDVPELGGGVQIYRNEYAVVKGTPYSSVYSSHLYGKMFQLSIRTGTTSAKSIILGFAEIYQQACSEGSRVFEVTAGSTTKTIDVYKEVGCNAAFDVRIDNIIPSATGVVDIMFKSMKNNAILSVACILENLATRNDTNTSPYSQQPLNKAGSSPSSIADLGFGPSLLGSEDVEVFVGKAGTRQIPEESPVETPIAAESSQPSVVVTAIPPATEVPQQASSVPTISTNTSPSTSQKAAASGPLVTVIPSSTNTSTPPAPSPAGEGVFGVPQASPTVSISVDPSPVDTRQPGDEILGPLDSSILPSASPSGIPSQTSTTSPTITPTPIPASPSPNPSTGLNPDGVVIEESPGLNPTPAPTITNSAMVSAGVSPAASPSTVSSTTGSSDVIIPAETEAPSPDPRGTIAPIPTNPISSVPNNGSQAIEVTDGSDTGSDSSGNPDAGGDGSNGEGPTIISGPYKNLINTKAEGNAFAIGMGILGALLVLLLLTCLFFAIFRSKGDSYTYTSGERPHDDPSQSGGYTENLGEGTGEYGNQYLYGGGAQDGYGGGETVGSRPQTQESFAYEGAAELGDTIGSGGYGQSAVESQREPSGGSGYGNAEADTFGEYSGMNVPPVKHDREAPVAETAGTGQYRLTMPTTASYQPKTGEIGYGQFPDPGSTRASDVAQDAEAAGDSFHVYHSVAQPTGNTSESSGKQERNVPVDSVEERESSIAMTGHSGIANGLAGGKHAHPMLSMGSDPSVGKSPYETGARVHIPSDSTGNVSETNPMFPGMQMSTTAAALISRVDGYSEKPDTELLNDFLYSDVRSSVTGATGMNGAMSTTQLRDGDHSQVSDEGPWPSWWADKKKLPAVSAQVDENLAASSSNLDDELKGNNSISSNNSNGVIRSIFAKEHGTVASTGNPGGSHALPFDPSSSNHVLPVKPSDIVANSSWLPSSPLPQQDEGVYNDDPEFDALRRRREPYVKSVANRLSYGPQAMPTYSSTSSSGDTPLAFPLKIAEMGADGHQDGDVRNSSSWINRDS